MAIKDEEDVAVLTQIPDDTANFLIISFLWDEFLFKYRNYFNIQKKLNFFGAASDRKSRYTWVDEDFREFMRCILFNLEPIEYHKKQHILEEFDDVNEILFVSSGKVVIGYDINRTKKYCL